MAAGWGEVREALKSGGPPPVWAELPSELALFAGLGDARVVAHLAQSLDGRIALADGRSRWISGEDDLDHTHRLRAVCDAVIVGARTVEVDDPQLTVRRVDGAHPVRVVVDPTGRLGRQACVFTDGKAPTWRVVGRGVAHGSDDLVLEAEDGVIAPSAVLEALRDRGIGRILVEGGGVTVSRFVEAGCVDRLHLVVAPLLVGEGLPGLSLTWPPATSLANRPRPSTRVWPLGSDWLFDCDLRGAWAGTADAAARETAP